MKIDIFFKTNPKGCEKVQYLGNLEIQESALEGLTKKEKEVHIEAVMLSSIAAHIEWTPVSEEDLEKEVVHGYTIN